MQTYPYRMNERDVYSDMIWSQCKGTDAWLWARHSARCCETVKGTVYISQVTQPLWVLISDPSNRGYNLVMQLCRGRGSDGKPLSKSPLPVVAELGTVMMSRLVAASVTKAMAFLALREFPPEMLNTQHIHAGCSTSTLNLRMALSCRLWMRPLTLSQQKF